MVAGVVRGVRSGRDLVGVTTIRRGCDVQHHRRYGEQDGEEPQVVLVLDQGASQLLEGGPLSAADNAALIGDEPLNRNRRGRRIPRVAERRSELAHLAEGDRTRAPAEGLLHAGKGRPR